MFWMFLVGIIVGMLIFAVIMKKYMIVNYKLNGSFEDVKAIVEETIPEFEGWGFPIPAWQFYQSQISKGLNYDNIKDMVMYFVCKPAHANKVISIDPKLGGIMPCTWAVYETREGEVYIAKMNIALMSKMYFGVIGEVMRDVAKTEEKMLERIREKLGR